MRGEEHSTFGEDEAQLILGAGWRQGSIFRPPAAFFVPVQIDRGGEWLVVCTQSCTVVSSNRSANPNIEFLVAKPVEKYNPRSHEATGRNSHCFHLPILGMPDAEALECDINRRFFADRRVCLEQTPDTGISASEEAVRNLAGWIARYYSRIALPNALVTRARNGLFKTIEKVLRAARPSGEELSASVDRIGVHWSPDSELQDGLYVVDLLFLCADADADTQLHSLLKNPLSPFTRDGGHDGIKVVYDTTVRSETFISAFDGYKRLTEWDYLSSLGEVAASES